MRSSVGRGEANLRNVGATNTFVEGDNLEVLRALEPGSVDLICTDPPYNTGNDFAYAEHLPRHARLHWRRGDAGQRIWA